MKEKQKNDPSTDNRKVHKRVLRFLNDARAPEDLMELRPNFFQEIQPPGLERQLIHDPSPADDATPLLERDIAEKLLCERDEISPIHGFAHFKEVKKFLDDSILKHLIDIFIRHFSGVSRGEWTSHGNVTVGGQTIVPRHAALLYTGKVIMIEGACADVPSRTWLWNPYAKKMDTTAPIPPGNNLYCSGHLKPSLIPILCRSSRL